MGLLLSDMYRVIKDEDVSYFSSVLILIHKHRQKVNDFVVRLADIDETKAMLDYSKRVQEKLGNDVSQHCFLLANLAIEHHRVYQCLLQHQAIAAIFEHDLCHVLITKYCVHASHVDEWQIDLERKELYRRPRITMEQHR